MNISRNSVKCNNCKRRFRTNITKKKKTMSFARAPKINNPKITPLAEHVSVVVVMHDQKKTMSLFCA